MTETVLAKSGALRSYKLPHDGMYSHLYVHRLRLWTQKWLFRYLRGSIYISIPNTAIITKAFIRSSASFLYRGSSCGSGSGGRYDGSSAKTIIKDIVYIQIIKQYYYSGFRPFIPRTTVPERSISITPLVTTCIVTRFKGPLIQ